jgi:hypothetical protein
MFRKIFPIAPHVVEYVYEGEIKWSKDIDQSSNEFITMLRNRWQLAENASNPWGAAIAYNNQMIAWFPELAFNGNGISDPAWATNPGGLGHVLYSNATVGTGNITSRYRRTLAHEIGHNHDRRHPTWASQPWLRPGLHYGFDTETNEVKYDYKIAAGGFMLLDFMVPARREFEAWIIPSVYIDLYNRMPNFVKMANQRKEIQTSALMVSGLVHQNGTGEFFPAYQINYGATPAGESGEYSLTLENESGQPLYTSLISAAFYNPDTPLTPPRVGEGEGEVSSENVRDMTDTTPPATTAGFNEVMPTVAGLKHIVLRKGTTELDRLTLSASSPTVTVLTPNGGEFWSGDEEIRWDSYDADKGDPEKLSYTILYSADNKNTWRTLETMYSQKSLMVNTALLPGGTQCYVRVMVTDGINTGEDDSNAAFSTQGNPPLAVIAAPPDKSQYGTYDLVRFIGRGVDLEEKVLPENMVWNSSLDGLIGKGPFVETVSLQSGTHTITLDVNDQDGFSSSASIQIGVKQTWDPLPGDLVYDGKVDYLDLLEFSRMWKQGSKLTMEADLNKDNKVNVKDLLLLQKLIKN